MIRNNILVIEDKWRLVLQTTRRYDSLVPDSREAKHVIDFVRAAPKFALNLCSACSELNSDDED
jgi:hypothetical protein